MSPQLWNRFLQSMFIARDSGTHFNPAHTMRYRWFREIGCRHPISDPSIRRPCQTLRGVLFVCLVWRGKPVDRLRLSPLSMDDDNTWPMGKVQNNKHKKYLQNKCSRKRKKSPNTETRSANPLRLNYTADASGFRTAPPSGKTDCCSLEDSSLPKVHFDGKLLTCGRNNEAPLA